MHIRERFPEASVSEWVDVLHYPWERLQYIKVLLFENEVWIGAGQVFLNCKDEEDRERNKEKNFVFKVVHLKY